MPKNRGGRPRTLRNKAITIRISEDSVKALEGKPNKSLFIDNLLSGKVSVQRCPKCGELIEVKIE